MQPPTPISDVLTITDMAAILRCSKGHVSNLIRGKVETKTKFPYYTIGRRTYSKRAWIEKFQEDERA